jgi:GT2 family glycosyltransferase
VTRISLVIPTRDRPGPLAACLEALAGSFPDDAETIVVSDGGRRPDVERWAEPLRLRLIEGPHGGPAAARNRGLAAAAGEIVAFTDDDCVPRLGWLAELTAHVSPAAAVAGTTVNGAAGAYADASQTILELVGRHADEAFFSGANVAFPAAALRELGGFDEAFRTAEDRELCRRWRAAGLELRRAAGAVVEHRPEIDLAGFLRRFYTYGRGARRFHTAPEASWRERTATLRFHAGLPVALAPYVRERGVGGGTRLLGLVGLWELANVAGFVAASGRRPRRPAPAVEAVEQG